MYILSYVSIFFEKEPACLSGLCFFYYYFYKPWQQTMDRWASSCHTPILPRASKDRLQQALTFPWASSNQIFCSFPLFPLFLLAVGVNQREVTVWRRLCVYSEMHLLKFFLLLLPFLWHCPFCAMLAFPMVQYVPLQVCLPICVGLSVCGDVWNGLCVGCFVFESVLCQRRIFSRVKEMGYKWKHRLQNFSLLTKV